MDLSSFSTLNIARELEAADGGRNHGERKKIRYDILAVVSFDIVLEERCGRDATPRAEQRPRSIHRVQLLKKLRETRRPICERDVGDIYDAPRGRLPTWLAFATLNQLIITSMTQLTKEHFDKLIRKLATNDKLNILAGVVTDHVAGTTRRFDDTDARLDTIADKLHTISETLLDHQVKLDAIMESLATRQEVRNLVRELKANGIKLDAEKIFLSGV